MNILDCVGLIIVVLMFRYLVRQLIYNYREEVRVANDSNSNSNTTNRLN